MEGLGYFRWFSAFHALENGRWNTHFPDRWIFSTLDLNRNTIGFRKWVGNDFQLFPVKAHLLRNGIAEIFDAGTDIDNRKRFNIAHDDTIIRLGWG
jgi:hypothetical protein